MANRKIRKYGHHSFFGLGMGWKKILGLKGKKVIEDDPGTPDTVKSLRSVFSQKRAASITSSRQSGISQFGGSLRLDSQNKAQVLHLLTLLNKERQRSDQLQSRVQAILGVNAEIKASAALQAEEERQKRIEAEEELLDHQRCLTQAETTIVVLKSEVDRLEAELMIAAEHVLAQQIVQDSLKEKLAGEQVAWQLLEQRNEEYVALEGQLKTSESERLRVTWAVNALQMKLQAKPSNSSTDPAQSTEGFVSSHQDSSPSGSMEDDLPLPHDSEHQEHVSEHQEHQASEKDSEFRLMQRASSVDSEVSFESPPGDQESLDNASTVDSVSILPSANVTYPLETSISSAQEVEISPKSAEMFPTVQDLAPHTPSKIPMLFNRPEEFEFSKLGKIEEEEDRSGLLTVRHYIKDSPA